MRSLDFETPTTDIKEEWASTKFVRNLPNGDQTAHCFKDGNPIIGKVGQPAGSDSVNFHYVTGVADEGTINAMVNIDQIHIGLPELHSSMNPGLLPQA